MSSDSPSPLLPPVHSFHPLHLSIPAACGQEFGQWAETWLGGPAGLAVLGGGESGWIRPSLHGSRRPGALNAELTTLTALYK